MKTLRQEFPNSTQVKELTYDKAKSELTVHFRSKDSIYVYHDVPLEVYTVLCEAASVGSALNQVVKQKNFKYTKIQ